MKGTQDNIRRVLAQADEIDIAEGRLAYPRYRETMRRLGEFYGFPIERVTAAFAALSPNNDYVKNLRSTVTLLWGKREGVALDRLTVSTYRACRNRAWGYLDGVDFLEATKGKKTRAFYRNILNPEDPDPVTIDGHMISVWAGRRYTMKEAITVRPRWRYDRVAEDYRAVARQGTLLAGSLIPNQLQAILWFTQKRLHKIVYDANLSLLDATDNWKLSIDPRDIRPYPVRYAKEERSRRDTMRQPRMF